MIRSSINQSNQKDVEIDLAPMIDCIFILLIFFIVTSVFVDDPGITVERPDVSGAEVADRSALLIAISADNRIFFDGQELQVEQVASFLRQTMTDEKTPLIIRADKNASHGIFAEVHAEANRAGIKTIQFATAKPDDN